MNLNDLFARLLSREFGICGVCVAFAWWLAADGHVWPAVALAAWACAWFTACRTSQKRAESQAPKPPD